MCGRLNEGNLGLVERYWIVGKFDIAGRSLRVGGCTPFTIKPWAWWLSPVRNYHHDRHLSRWQRRLLLTRCFVPLRNSERHDKQKKTPEPTAPQTATISRSTATQTQTQTQKTTTHIAPPTPPTTSKTTTQDQYCKPSPQLNNSFSNDTNNP